MITTEKLESNLDFLIETDQKYAHAKACMQALDKQEKTIIAQELLLSNEKTVALREANARVSPAYDKWKIDYKLAVYDYEIIRNKRSTANIIIEVWRSQLSAQKEGIII